MSAVCLRCVDAVSKECHLQVKKEQCMLNIWSSVSSSFGPHHTESSVQSLTEGQGSCSSIRDFRPLAMQLATIQPQSQVMKGKPQSTLKTGTYVWKQKKDNKCLQWIRGHLSPSLCVLPCSKHPEVLLTHTSLHLAAERSGGTSPSLSYRPKPEGFWPHRHVDTRHMNRKFDNIGC